MAVRWQYRRARWVEMGRRRRRIRSRGESVRGTGGMGETAGPVVNKDKNGRKERETQ